MYNKIQYLYDVDEMGSVVGILNSDGKRIASYAYDGWGKVIEKTGDKDIADLNPLRYRGYYYDEESGFYYLHNRYYDPELKRMINMDSYTDTQFGIFSHNLYAYCENTPVNACNYNGNLPSWFNSKKYTAQDYLWEETKKDPYYKYEPWSLNIWQTKAYKNGGWQSNYISYSSSTVLIAYC